MKHVYFCFSVFLFSVAVSAQQVPNANFEDWSGSKFDGKEQPASWYASNVEQVGMKFNFAHKETGRSGYCMMVQGQSVGAMGITETSPGYFSLGKPWVYLEGITKIKEATAGTCGGLQWSYRPDTMSVWIKRTGGDVSQENFNLLYYAWSGTTRGEKYRGKNGNCTSTSRTDEESDIRQALDGNTCGTLQKATQIAEGLWTERRAYNEWVNIKVPIYYMSNDVPEKMNIIFSANRYPDFRSTTGIYEGNSLYVDDVELIYSASIQTIYIDDMPWYGFNSASSEVQTYSLGIQAVSLPKITAKRGAGIITNPSGQTASFPGRELGSNEMTITDGVIDKTPTVITVTSDDGKKTQVYKIQFVRAPSTNANLVRINVNGKAISGFNPNLTTYTCELPYGTTAAPHIEVVKSEEKQKVDIKQPSSISDKATITVTAADGKTKKTYTLSFSIAQLADNTLKDIQFCAKETASEPDAFVSVPGFTSALSIYSLSIPLGTKILKVKAISAYPDKEQTIIYKEPDVLNGGTYQISVTTPGNPIAKVYKLMLKEEKSTYALLKDLQVGDGMITGFDPASAQTYYVNLPIGASTLPKLSYEKGEKYQTVNVDYSGLDTTYVAGETKKTTLGIDGTIIVTVTAAAGNQKIYKIAVTTEKSDNNTLTNIYLNGEPLPNFAPTSLNYTCELTPGTTALPEITYDKGDIYQSITILRGGLNGVTRISVTAGDGTTSIYQLNFSCKPADNVDLKGIFLNDEPLDGFQTDKLEYSITLPQGTEKLPTVTWTAGDAFQTITSRTPSGLNGDYRITVRAQSGKSAIYILHFKVEQSEIDTLVMIYLDGEPIKDFKSDSLNYTDTLPVGTSRIPTVTWTKGDDRQKVLSIFENDVQTLTVTAESGSKRVYTVQFIIQRSTNAKLEMIYLDGVPMTDFESDKFSYERNITGDVAPKITVDKAAGQQVTILSPSGTGEAKIIVKPEEGASNEYIIAFIKQAAAEALLQTILIDGQPLKDFDERQFEYDLIYKEDTLPRITWTAKERQTVQMLRNKNVVSLYVKYEGQFSVYKLNFTHQPSNDSTLKNIFLDGDPMALEAGKYDYDIPLPAGSDMPTLTYEKRHDNQSVVLGSSDATTVQLTVTAPDKQTTCTYTLHFTIDTYENVQLKNIEMPSRFDTFQFKPEWHEYTLPLYDGDSLPQPIITADKGQTTFLYDESKNKQVILVIAESGDQTTYELNYTYKKSPSPYLKTIYIGKDSLSGFEPTKADTVYTYTLPRLTNGEPTVEIPAVNPIYDNEFQQITTYFCHINDTLKIEVLSADGANKFTYKIAFPVEKSFETRLGMLSIDGVDDFEFNPEQTEYTVILPYQTDSCPAIFYAKKEGEGQDIRFISRPLGDTSEIIVTAENGDQRTYKILFKAEEATEANRLYAISIVETGQKLKLNPTTSEYEIPLPYGTRTMTVSYSKNYDEQTVFIQPGGINAPTKITVKANRANEKDFVYTLTPKVVTQNPAVLSSIKINGEEITGFDKNRFTYVINVEDVGNVPQVTYDKESSDNVRCYTEQDLWHWSAVVSCQGYTNEYKIFWHYPNDEIPNGEFTESVDNAKGSAKKPKGWNATNDYVGGESLAWPNYAEDYVQCKNGQVTLYNHGSTFWNWGASGNACAPAVINLANMTARQVVSGGSKTQVSGYKDFYNTPDSAKFKYKLETLDDNKQGALFLFKFRYSDNSDTSFYHQKKNKMSEDTIALIPLLLSEKKVKGYDIVIDASSATFNDGKGCVSAKLHVDWVRFSYNSTPKAAKVNGKDASLKDKVFTVTLDDPEDINIRSYEFNGEVSDQAQKLTWEEPVVEGNYSVRRASIRNYAEDGTYTDGYSLTVKRPLDTRNTLKGLLIDGLSIESFDPDKGEYTVHLASSVHHLPDVMPVPSSSRQTIKTDYADSTYTITVQPEKGEPKEYKIRFVTDLSNDTTLADIIADGLTYDPAKREYNLRADKLPEIRFVKKMDGQTVDLNHGVLTVTAEDGSVGHYTITATPEPKATSGKLSNIIADGEELGEFSSEEPIMAARPRMADFKLVDLEDTVIALYTSKQMSWSVINSEGDTNTYIIEYPVELSTDNTLQQIVIDEQQYTDYSDQIEEFEIRRNANAHTQLFSGHVGQTIGVERINGGLARYYRDTIKMQVRVHPEDEEGEMKTYQLNFMPDLQDIATLDSIWIDGKPLPDFDPEQTEYTYTIPVGDSKQFEPKMPSVTYFVTDTNATVTLSAGKLDGDPTYITVTPAAGGIQPKTYSVSIKSEKSHNAYLSGIVVNGEPLDHFEKGRHYYSMTVRQEAVLLDWASEDAFQTVKERQANSTNGTIYALHVMAEDGTTTETYEIEIYNESKSDQPFLSNILLNDTVLDDFKPELNPKLKFDPMQNTYNITLPMGSTSIPDVQASLLTDGQEIEITQGENVATINVTAADGEHTNTYTLNFIIPLSNDANLGMIYLGEDSLYVDGNTKQAAFQPDEYLYAITLPVGAKSLPEINAQKGHQGQNLSEVRYDGSSAMISVMAEDKTTTQEYRMLFFYTLSDNDTLQNLLPVDNFVPQTPYYDVSLPVGTQHFPSIDWEEGDEYQTVAVDTFVKATTRDTLIDTVRTMDTIRTVIMSFTDEGKIRLDTLLKIDTLIRLDTVVIKDTTAMTYQVHVYAESGKQRVYSVNYEILKSDVDTLQMIYVDNKRLENFDAAVDEYSYILPATTTDLPEVVYIEGDQYQTISTAVTLDTLTSKSLGKKVAINVMAQNGNRRTYTLHFPLEISTETQLDMIYYGGRPLPGFNSDIFMYTIDTLDINATDAPIVTVREKAGQSVKISVADTVLFDDKGWKVTIAVLAEDQVSDQDYTILFARKKSTNNQLLNIDFDSLTTEIFDGTRREYTITLDDDQMPTTFEYTKAEEGQIVETSEPTLAPDGTYYVDITVTPPAGMEYQDQYRIVFNFKSYLDQLILNGTTVSDFSRDSLSYTIHHAPGSSTNDFYTPDDFNFVLSDPLATSKVEESDGLIVITVTSRDKCNVTVYIIMQVIDQSEENRLERIYLDNDSTRVLKNFDPDKDFYTYILADGHLAPILGAIPMDTLSEVVITQNNVGDTSFIFCTSQKGVQRRYKVLFQFTSVNDALTPNSKDVLIKVLDGGQIKVATIRKDVTFALYDISGRMIAFRELPTCDPNEATVYIDQNGQEKLFDVEGNSGIILTLDPHRIYFYCFFESQKKKICSGKLKMLK